MTHDDLILGFGMWYADNKNDKKYLVRPVLAK